MRSSWTEDIGWLAAGALVLIGAKLIIILAVIAVLEVLS
jgi:hypothetical protein